MCEAASFWQENVIAIVILLSVFAKMLWWWKQVTKCIIDILSFCDWERALPSSVKVTALTFLVKKSSVKLSRVSIFENTWENFKANFVLVVLESKALYYSNKDTVGFLLPTLFNSSFPSPSHAPPPPYSVEVQQETPTSGRLAIPCKLAACQSK